MPYYGKYGSPADVLRDRRLSNCEKVQMLESWRDDKEALIRASEEGMRGEVRSDLLEQIEDARNSLYKRPPSHWMRRALSST